jgi:hypothetical protein
LLACPTGTNLRAKEFKPVFASGIGPEIPGEKKFYNPILKSLSTVILTGSSVAYHKSGVAIHNRFAGKQAVKPFSKN